MSVGSVQGKVMLQFSKLAVSNQLEGSLTRPILQCDFPLYVTLVSYPFIRQDNEL
jgi:hypothetical protein